MNKLVYTSNNYAYESHTVYNVVMYCTGLYCIVSYHKLRNVTKRKQNTTIGDTIRDKNEYYTEHFSASKSSEHANVGWRGDGNTNSIIRVVFQLRLFTVCVSSV